MVWLCEDLEVEESEDILSITEQMGEHISTHWSDTNLLFLSLT